MASVRHESSDCTLKLLDTRHAILWARSAHGTFLASCVGFRRQVRQSSVMSTAVELRGLATLRGAPELHRSLPAQARMQDPPRGRSLGHCEFASRQSLRGRATQSVATCGP